MPAYNMANAAWDTALSREEAWLQQESPPPFTDAPPLSASAGGPFDLVQAYVPYTTERSRQLILWRRAGGESGREDRITLGEKMWSHDFALTLIWPTMDPSGDYVQDQRDLETAIAAVLTRIRGPLQDKTHNGAFADVGEERAWIGVRYVVDAWQARDGNGVMQVQIDYTATDVFIG